MGSVAPRLSCATADDERPTIMAAGALPAGHRLQCIELVEQGECSRSLGEVAPLVLLEMLDSESSPLAGFGGLSDKTIKGLTSLLSVEEELSILHALEICV